MVLLMTSSYLMSVKVTAGEHVVVDQLELALDQQVRVEQGRVGDRGPPGPEGGDWQVLAAAGGLVVVNVEDAGGVGVEGQDGGGHKEI